MGQELNEQAENSESFERFLREAGKEAKGDEILKLFLQTWRLVRDLVGKRVAEVTNEDWNSMCLCTLTKMNISGQRES